MSGELLLVGWVGCAIFGGLISRLREQSAFDGVILGGLFGPLGVLLVMFQPDRRPVCRECGGRMVPKARRCRHCGSVRAGPEARQRAGG